MADQFYPPCFLPFAQLLHLRVSRGSMAQSGDDEQHCLARLEQHESWLDALCQLLGRSARVVGRDDDLTRELYRSIKTDLKHEAHQGDTALVHESDSCTRVRLQSRGGHSSASPTT